MRKYDILKELIGVSLILVLLFFYVTYEESETWKDKFFNAYRCAMEFGLFWILKNESRNVRTIRICSICIYYCLIRFFYKIGSYMFGYEIITNGISYGIMSAFVLVFFLCELSWRK